MNLHEQEERDFHVSTDAEWDRFDTELGAYNRNDTQRAWILSDRDCWYRNPFYVGPPVPHPEDCHFDEDEGRFVPTERPINDAIDIVVSDKDPEDEIPF